uniref:Uncharacterized protein n=1 Tax=Anguilla anguilla TaxID=7936 RepID=A0A0E9R0V7_ANGAN
MYSPSLCLFSELSYICIFGKHVVI